MNTIHCFSMSTEYCRLVLCKASACIDDRHLKLMAEFDLGEPNFEVLRKVAAMDAPHQKNITTTDVLKEIVRAPRFLQRICQGPTNGLIIHRAVIKAKW